MAKRKRFGVGDKAFYTGGYAIFPDPVELFGNVRMAVITERRKDGNRNLYHVNVRFRITKHTQNKDEAMLVKYQWQTENYCCNADELIPEKEAWAKAIKLQTKFTKEALAEIQKSIGKTNEWLDNVAETLRRMKQIERKFGLK